MITWALIPCSCTKALYACAATELYKPSQLFQGAHSVATRQGQWVRILSAHYGVLRPDDVVAPYDETLSVMPRYQRKEWAHDVLRDLLIVMQPGDKVVSYLFSTYAEYVVPGLRRNGYVVEEPLRGMKRGKQLAWFKQQLEGRPAA